jgi:hypothetical protein
VNVPRTSLGTNNKAAGTHQEQVKLFEGTLQNIIMTIEKEM